MKKNNKTRTVIITGGNRGVGESISRAFYNQGNFVLIGAQTNTALAERLGKRAIFKKTDVRKETDHHALVEAALDWTGRLDVYINCAGFSLWKPIEKIEEALLDLIIDTNLKGVLWGCKAASSALKKSGSIINISSLAGKRGSANNSVYCASKFAVNGITQSMAKELGPRGIRVNAVCPVYVKTRGLLQALQDKNSPAQGRDVEKFLKDFEKTQTALKRLPTAEEIARVCLFLASEEASAITGQCINVDCGVLPQ
jgi:3-oxoacyl-[acyl-carrier protein] reductase/meso-butanediol dehydrogenase/(S,S)-butanediol dehydrogenase/diacetyl reductase